MAASFAATALCVKAGKDLLERITSAKMPARANCRVSTPRENHFRPGRNYRFSTPRETNSKSRIPDSEVLQNAGVKTPASEKRFVPENEDVKTPEFQGRAGSAAIAVFSARCSA
jgi:hypothetical protein